MCFSEYSILSNSYSGNRNVIGMSRSVISLFLLAIGLEVCCASTELLWSITGHCWVTVERWIMNKQHWLCQYVCFPFYFSKQETPVIC